MEPDKRFKKISNCCKAQISILCEPNGDCHHICVFCHTPCDAVSDYGLKPKCTACYDTGSYSVVEGGGIAMGDFVGDPSYYVPPKIIERPCPKCTTASYFDKQFAHEISKAKIDLLEKHLEEMLHPLYLVNPEGILPVEKEIAICAAVRTTTGKVFRGHRHSDCFMAIKGRFLIPGDKEEDQGFITSRNRYVDRIEGKKLQDAAGIPSLDPNGYHGNRLFSEDLY